MTQTLVALAAAAVVALVVGRATADVRAPDYRGYTIGTIRSMNSSERPSKSGTSVMAA